MTDFFKSLSDAAVSKGAYKAAVIKTSEVVSDTSFRTLCEQNVCGNYGKNWKCPPDAGDINALISELYSYEYILVYQSVNQLEDSYDFEGMAAAANKHQKLMLAVRDGMENSEFKRKLFLGAAVSARYAQKEQTNRAETRKKQCRRLKRTE